MSPLDPDAEARAALRRHRAFATLLLAAMGALTLLGYALPAGRWRDLLEAAARSGFVGGIADWFAVVALFRHPLGLPIPHTAILPAQKERLGRALGRFVAGHVFTEAEIGRSLTHLDLPAILARFLADPEAARPAAQGLAALLPRLLASLEDGRARRLLGRIVPRLLGGEAGGRLLARALRGLVAGGRHQEVFGFILGELRASIAAREEALRIAIEERVREQGGRLVGWALGASIARRALAAVSAEFDRMGPEDSEMRAAFDEWVKREITRIEEDPERARELGRSLRQIFGHESVQAWLGDVWSRLRGALEADAARPAGRTVTLLEGAFGNLGALLAADPAARARLDRAALGIARSLLPAARERLSVFIAEVVGNWDSATLTERLELRVGKDLQYVRMNGTLVGFLAGGVLYGLLSVLFGGAGGP